MILRNFSILALSAALLVGPVQAAVASSQTAELFGRHEVASMDTSAFTKWHTAIAEQRAQQPTEKTAEWKAFVESQRGQSQDAQIEAVNTYMNKVAFISDQENYGTNDKWATVEEFMARGGDCEDYSFAKYTLLRELGFDASQMRIVILYDSARNERHAVLALYLHDRARILDNQTEDIREANDITNYQPIYAISQNSWWRYL